MYQEYTLIHEETILEWLGKPGEGRYTHNDDLVLYYTWKVHGLVIHQELFIR